MARPVRRFERIKDTINGVKVDALIVGDYPGDGKEKPIAFPVPQSVKDLSADGLPYLNLRTLLELKTASGMTATHRLQDLADVIQLIRINSLSKKYAEQLHRYVRDKFLELWQAAQVSEDY